MLSNLKSNIFCVAFLQSSQLYACMLVYFVTEFVQLYFTSVFCCLHGGLPWVWSFTSVSQTEVKLKPVWASLHPSHLNTHKEVILHQKEFYPRVKFQTTVNLFWISCKRTFRYKALKIHLKENYYQLFLYNVNFVQKHERKKENNVS